MPVGDTPAMRFEAILVPGAERAVGHLRHWLRDVLGAGHPVLGDASVCLSEVLTNALRYTDSGRGGQVRVELGFAERCVRVEVVDDGGASTVPQLVHAPEEEAVSGRGLRIVAFLSAEWGAERRGRGHAVWFEIRS